MIELISTPYKNRTEDPVNQLQVKWLMANNPLYFGLQRKDLQTITAIRYNDDIANPKVILFFQNTDFLINLDLSGNFIFVSTPYFSGNYEVISSGSFGILIDLDWTFNTTFDAIITNGFINYKENYYLNILITDVSTNLPLTTHKIRTSNEGLAKIDLSGLIKNLFTIKNEFNYSDINSKDQNSVKQISISVQENWTDSANDYSVVDTLFLVNGAKQIQNKYGASVVDYCFDSTRNLTEKAKFLTLFTPTFFANYPFSISFINIGLENFDETLEGLATDLVKVETVNGTANETSLIQTDNVNFINHLKLTDSYSDQKIFVKLKQSGTVLNNDAYVDEDYVDLGYVDEATTESLSANDLTESLQVNIQNDCVDNPVYLRWFNQLGGYNYWLFSGNNFSKSEIAESEFFEQTIEDIETATGTAEYLSRNNQNSIILGADNLSQNDKQLVTSLIYSRKVEMYNSTLNTWTDVLVKAGSFDVLEARETRSDIQVEIMLPKTYLQ